MPEFMRKLHTAGLERDVKTGHRHLNWRGTELVALRKNGEEFPVEVSFGEALAWIIHDFASEKRKGALKD